MGRPSQGWKLFRDPGRKFWSVRFSFAGKRYELGTGEEAEDRAARRAAELYAETIAGKRTSKQRGRGASDDRPLGPVGMGWLNSVAETIDPSTIRTYLDYINAHFVPFFKTVGGVTEGAFANYIQARLRCVMAETVTKERGAMIGLLAYALNVERRKINLPEVPERAVGKRHAKGKRTRTPLSPKEAHAITRALPQTRVIVVKEKGSKAGSWCFRAFVRARVVVSYETSLRPKALDLLSVPEHFHYGSKTLTITRDIDKARFARVVALSKPARRYLNWCLRQLGPHYTGPIFGKFRSRKALRNAGRAAGLPAARVATLHPYDLRAARLTHWAESGNLPATAWQAGHKRISTTAIYAEGSLRAAQDLVSGSR